MSHCPVRTMVSVKLSYPGLVGIIEYTVGITDSLRNISLVELAQSAHAPRAGRWSRTTTPPGVVLQARERGDMLQMPDRKRQTRRPGKANELIVQPLVTLGVLRLSFPHTAARRLSSSRLIMVPSTGSMSVKYQFHSLVESSNPMAGCKTGVRPRAFVAGRCVPPWSRFSTVVALVGRNCSNLITNGCLLGPES